MIQKISLILLFLGCSFLVLWQLGANFLTHWDEAWYAEVSRNMVYTGNLFSPVWNTHLFFEKPPLYFWLTAVWFNIFGISEFSIRLTSAISAISLAAVLYYFGSRLYNKTTSVLSIVILFSSPFFLYRSRTGNLDTLLVLWITLALLSFLLGLERNKRWFIVSGLALGFGFLTKGGIGLYPLFIIVLYLLLTKNIKVMWTKWFGILNIIWLLVGAGWLLISIHLHGNEFIQQFFISNTEKFNFGIKSIQQFSFEYIFHLKSGLKLWFPFLGVSIAYMMFRYKNRKILLLLLFFVVFLFIMSFAYHKSSWYALPLYPIGALLIAHALYAVSSRFKIMPMVFGGVLLLAALQVIIYRHEYVVPDIAGDESRVALYAKQATEKNEVIYLTNYYYPSVVYYSERKIYAVYSDHEINSAWWVFSKSKWEEILRQDNVSIITTEEEFKDLRDTFPMHTFEMKYKSGNKLFIKKI
ncbi:MAG: glycosyltransferase family 39 protein [Candidatus Levyibacteriota bacterium]